MLAGVVLLVLLLVFFGTGIATGSKLFFTNDIAGSDFWHMNYPAKSFYAEALGQGRLPLWSPLIGTGMPLHAAAEVGSLYPLNLLAFLVLPFSLALNWAILGNLLLAGTLLACYARQMGACRGGAVFAAVTFGFSGFLIVHLKHTAMVASAAWAPLLLLLLERHASSRSRRSLVLLSLAVCVMAFGSAAAGRWCY